MGVWGWGVGGITPKEERPINHCAVSALTSSLSDEGQGRGGGKVRWGWGESTTVTTLWPCLPVTQAHAGAGATLHPIPKATGATGGTAGAGNVAGQRGTRQNLKFRTQTKPPSSSIIFFSHGMPFFKRNSAVELNKADSKGISPLEFTYMALLLNILWLN